MSDKLKLNDVYGKVFRHKRLFNFVVSPISLEKNYVNCLSGKNIEKKIPIDYFKRDWKEDKMISLEDLQEKIKDYPDNTPFTTIYSEFFELDDGKEHSYLHFDDFDEENMYRFPVWKISTYKKEERDKKINPYTMIMPVKDNMVDEISKELELINEIRKENEFIEFDDFAGFEFGLLKILEKKFLREI